MGVFTYWPYTNLHELNFDWLIQKLRNFISEAETKFNSVDEEMEYLKENFTALKDYVDSYFDSLDIVQIVNDKLEEMLDDGTIQALLTRSIPELASLTGDYIGKPIVRERIDYNTNYADEERTNSFQNMLVNGDYIYTFRTISGNVASFLRVYNKNTNEFLYEVEVPGLGHGGSLFIKENILYCISITNAKLFTFDLSNPSFPSLLGSRETGLTAGTQIVGWTGANWIIKTGFNYFSTDSQFNNQSFLYTIEHTGTMQDIYLDATTMLIYIVTYKPSTIQIYDALDGSLFSTLNVPNIINYIGVSETEGIHVENGSVYVSCMNVTGAPGSSKAELVIFRMDLRNKINYRGIYNMAGVRFVQVNYSQSPIEFNFSSNQAIVKYMEDAQNLFKSINTVGITVTNDYPESFRIFTNCAVNFQTYSSGAIMVNPDIKCTIQNFDRFSGTYTGNGTNEAECQIYISSGAIVNFDRFPGTSVASGKYRIWAYKSTVIINQSDIGNRLVNSAIFVYAKLFTPGLVGDHVIIVDSEVVCKALLRAANYEDQQITANSTIVGKIRQGASTDRWNLTNITARTYPVQFNLFLTCMNNTSLRSIDNVPVFISTDSTATLNLKYWWASGTENTWKTAPLTLSRTSETVAASFLGVAYTYYTYTITTSETLPSSYGVADIY